MSSTNPQPAAGDHVSIMTVVLSSSIVLAAITGVFYLVGGAKYEGYSEALGLSYLARLQPPEYVFDGAQLIFIFSSMFASGIGPLGLLIIGAGAASAGLP